jgi:hypothetical protein
MADKTIIEDLLELLEPDQRTAVQAKLAANPKLIAQDKFVHSLFGAYKGLEEGTTPATTTTTTTTETPAAAHTPTVPSAAATTTPVAAAAATTTAASSADNKAIMDMLANLNKKLENVVTADQIPKLGAELVNNAIAHSLRQADELAVIRETHREEFGEKLDKAAFEKFVLDAQDPTTKRSPYATLTAAYDAMVSQKRIDKKIADGITEGVKHKTSGAAVTGQTQSTSLSPAQQVIAKAKATGGGGKSNLQAAIDRMAKLNSDNAAAVQ